MKLTNGDIFGAQEPLRKLTEQKFPVMVSYKLAKLVVKLNEQVKVIDEVRQGLIKKHGKTDETGNTSVKPEGKGWLKFVEEFNELMAQEVEVVCEKVKLPENIDGKPFCLEPSILMALEKFIDLSEKNA